MMSARARVLVYAVTVAQFSLHDTPCFIDRLFVVALFANATGSSLRNGPRRSVPSLAVVQLSIISSLSLSLSVARNLGRVKREPRKYIRQATFGIGLREDEEPLIFLAHRAQIGKLGGLSFLTGIYFRMNSACRRGARP